MTQNIRDIIEVWQLFFGKICSELRNGNIPSWVWWIIGQKLISIRHEITIESIDTLWCPFTLIGVLGNLSVRAQITLDSPFLAWGLCLGCKSCWISRQFHRTSLYSFLHVFKICIVVLHFFCDLLADNVSQVFGYRLILSIHQLTISCKGWDCLFRLFVWLDLEHCFRDPVVSLDWMQFLWCSTR